MKGATRETGGPAPGLPPVIAWLMSRLFRAGLRASDAPELVIAQMEARLEARLDAAKDSRIPDPAGSGSKRDGTAFERRPASDHDAPLEEQHHG